MKETLIKALKEGGAELLRYYGTNLEFSVKESQSSIVTKADVKSEAIISGIIRSAFPTHNIVAEESGFSDLKSEYTWVVDPLDGTSNFAAGLPWFGVLIALFKGETPILGGAYLPVSNNLYLAERGKGATIDGKPLVIKNNIILKNSLIIFNVDFSENEDELDDGLAIYKRIVKSARNIRCTNCLLDFLYTAESRFGAVINMYTKIWDIAALGLIVEESGGDLRFTNGEKVHYQFDENVTQVNFPVMAGPAGIIEEIKNKVLLTTCN